MPNYYFNLDGALSTAVAFKDVAHAREEALCYIAQIAKEAAQDFWQQPLLGMTVTDEGGKILFTLRLVGTIVAAAT